MKTGGQEQGEAKQRLVDLNWLTSCLDSSSAGVWVCLQPVWAAPLFQYTNIIYRTYTEFIRVAWLQCIGGFQMRGAINLALP